MAKKTRYEDDTPAEQGSYVVVATKISNTFFKRLLHVCRCKGLTIYSFIQTATETVLRYCDDRHNLSPEIEQAMTLFEHLEGWKDTYNLADPNSTHEIQVEEAVYFMSKQGKKGMRTMLIEKPFMGHWTQTYNPKDIVERTFAVTCPDLYRQYRRLGAMMNTSCMLETLLVLADLHGRDEDLAEIRKSFEDNDRSDWGIKPHEGAPYRRKMNKNIESPEFDFTPFDQEL